MTGGSVVSRDPARDVVLVIGSGASYGARPRAAPHLRPPMGNALAAYLLRWFDANAPRDNDPLWGNSMGNPRDFGAPSKSLYRSSPKFDDPDLRPILVRAVERSVTSSTAFEDVMNELLREETRRSLDKVNDVICYSFLCGRECAFPEEEDLYDQLFSGLRASLRAVITPNYDLLVEEALERVGLTYRCRGIAEAGDADVVIDKFHGSVDWFLPSGSGVGSTPEIARRAGRPLEAVRQTRVLSYSNAFGVHAASGHRRWNAVSEHKLGHGSPVLVTYGPGKDTLYGRPHLERVRQECAADLQESPPKKIISLGISPPRGGGDDDAWEKLCQVFHSLPSAKEYWTRIPEHHQQMAAYGFEPRLGYFDELLAAL